MPLEKPIFIKVEELAPGTRGHNLVLKVVKVNLVLERKRGSRTIRVAEAVVGDSTACVLLTVRNEQVDAVQEGATLVLRNSKVEMYKNYMRLAVDKWGLIEERSDNPLKEDINTSRNISDVEYEIVRVDVEGKR